jgi:4a-hydroxytetrahydrobiopterin dehydratase
MAKLSSKQISEKLRSLKGWKLKGDAIAKLFKFEEFPDGIRFVDRIAEIAQRMDHHPDININYTRITFSCSTHDQGGITEKDFKLATEIEKAFKASGN